MNYYISDLHLFENREEDVRFLKLWNDTVRQGDDVYILGDVGRCSGNLVRAVKRLKGRKHLIAGNWDIRPISDRKFRDCFVEIKQIKEIKDAGEKIVLCHYPMAEWNGMYDGVWHMYGHIHDNEGRTKEIMESIPRAINVSRHVIGRPMTFAELRAFYAPGILE